MNRSIERFNDPGLDLRQRAKTRISTNHSITNEVHFSLASSVFDGTDSIRVLVSDKQNKMFACIQRAYDASDQEQDVYRQRGSKITFDQAIDLHHAFKRAQWSTKVLQSFLQDRFPEWIGNPRLAELPLSLLQEIVHFPPPARQKLSRAMGLKGTRDRVCTISNWLWRQPKRRGMQGGSRKRLFSKESQI
jgi:hypothetical protein